MIKFKYIHPDEATEDLDESSKLAEELYKYYFITNRSRKTRNILVTGGWGTGKSTIKQILLGHLEINYKKKNSNIDLVEFNAMQFEENSQVTSKFYSTIGNYFEKKKYKLKNKFNAISYLKKESNSTSTSVNIILQVIFIGLIAFLLTKISKIEMLNNLFSNGFFPAADPALCNKIMIVIIIMSIMFWKKEWLLELIAAKLPRLSHVEILQKINLNGRELIIFVDEVDRLTPEAAKYLLDELLIFKDSLDNDHQNRLTIFLFCDVNSIEIAGNKKTTMAYLEKHFEYKHRVYFSSNISYIESKLKELYSIPYVEINSKINLKDFCKWIADKYSSFREIMRLFDNLPNNLSETKIDKIIKHYVQTDNASSTIKFYLARNSSMKNYVYILFQIISLYIYITQDHADKSTDKKVDYLYPNLALFLEILLTKIRNQLVFSKVTDLSEKIELKLLEYKKDHKRNTSILNFSKEELKLINSETRPSKINPNSYYMNKIIRLKEKLSTKPFGESGDELLKLLSESLGIQDLISKLFGFIERIEEVIHNLNQSIIILETCMTIVKFKISEHNEVTINSSLGETIIKSFPDDESEFIGRFDEEFREIAKIIYYETKFYKNKIDLKFNCSAETILKEVYNFIEQSIY